MIARHVGTFAESMQHKLDLVVEGHQMLSEKIDRVRTELSERIDCVKRKLDAVAARGERTAAKLDTVAEKLDAVAARGEQTAAKLDTVADKLDAVAARGEQTAAKLDTVADKLDAVAADLSAHRKDTEAHRTIYQVKESGE
jgi:methyl-accepting chemotaxis protein